MLSIALVAFVLAADPSAGDEKLLRDYAIRFFDRLDDPADRLEYSLPLAPAEKDRYQAMCDEHRARMLVRELGEKEFPKEKESLAFVGRETIRRLGVSVARGARVVFSDDLATVRSPSDYERSRVHELFLVFRRHDDAWKLDLAATLGDFGDFPPAEKNRKEAEEYQKILEKLRARGYATFEDFKAAFDNVGAAPAESVKRQGGGKKPPLPAAENDEQKSLSDLGMRVATACEACDDKTLLELSLPLDAANVARLAAKKAAYQAQQKIVALAWTRFALPKFEPLWVTELGERKYSSAVKSFRLYISDDVAVLRRKDGYLLCSPLIFRKHGDVWKYDIVGSSYLENSLDCYRQIQASYEEIAQKVDRREFRKVEEVIEAMLAAVKKAQGDEPKAKPDQK